MATWLESDLPSTQYGHRMCSRLTLPHDEHLLSDVISLSPFPAMNRCRFLRYDVFFLGTALRIPSHMSANEGIFGRDSEGIASAPKGVLRAPKGCARRCSRGAFRTGRAEALNPGSSVCHSGGSGRARAIVAESWRWCCKLSTHVCPCRSVQVAPYRSATSALSLPRHARATPFPRLASPRESRQRSVPELLLPSQRLDLLRLALSACSHHPSPNTPPPISS